MESETSDLLDAFFAQHFPPPFQPRTSSLAPSKTSGNGVADRNSEGPVAIHFEGEGLVHVFRKASVDGEDVSIQFSIYGEALAIFTLEEERERLFYERDMGYGKREKADELAQEVLRELEPTITEEEAMAYYL